MRVEVLIEEARWRGAGLEALAERACGAVSDHLGLRGGAIGLLGCNDARIAALNRRFRGKSGPTNVLSWPVSWPAGGAWAEEAGEGSEREELGDIAIAWETCAREADEQGKRFAHHVTHLLVHATLHLLGHDHMDEAGAAAMEALEVEILGKLGIPDPYEGEEHGL